MSSDQTPKRIGPPPGSALMYDLLLIGLMFMREANADVLARPASSIFNALRHARLYTERHRQGIVKDYRLIGLIQTNSTIVHEAKPLRRYVLEEIGKLDTHLLFYIPPATTEPGAPPVPVMLQHPRLVGPGGYELIITEAGIVAAHKKLPQFSELLDAEKFADAWKNFRQQSRRAAMDRQRGKTGGVGVVAGEQSTDEVTVHVDRDAKWGEADWEF